MPLQLFREFREIGTDFIAGTAALAAEPFVSALAGTGAIALSTSVPPYYGIVNLSAGATTTGSSKLNIDAGLVRFDAGPHRFETVFRIPTLSNTGVSDFNVILGFNDTTVDQLYITIDTSNKVKFVYTSNSVSTTVDASATAGTLVAGTWYKAVIDVGAVQANSNQSASPNQGGPIVGARFFFGPAILSSGNLGATQLTKFLGSVPYALLPQGAGRETGVELSVTGVTSGASRSIDIDYAFVKLPGASY